MRLPLLVGLSVSLSLLAEDTRPLPEGVSLEIAVQETQGEVDVRTGPKEKWVAAEKGMKLAPGAKICTGVGSGAAVSFGTNSVATVAECTVCEIRTFEMQGDELVASIHLEPGVARVSVQQLAQFHTDFRVSTPRLTCSVKGSIGWFVSQCDEIPDWVRNEGGRVGTDRRELATRERTNSRNESNHDLSTAENVAHTTPTGSTNQEVRDANLLANNASNLDLNISDANLNLDSSPSGGDNSTNVNPPPDPGCDPELVAAALAFLVEHGLVNLDQFYRDGPEESGLLQKQAQDEWDDVNSRLADDIYRQKRDVILFLERCSPFGGILHDHLGIASPGEHDILHAELASEEAMARALRNLANQEQDVPAFRNYHELGHEQGTPTLVSQGGSQRHAAFQNQLASNPDSNLRAQQESDYHDPVTGLESWMGNYNQIADAARNGQLVDLRQFQFALIAGEHLEWHEANTGLDSFSYGMEHTTLHQRLVDVLLTQMDLVDPGTWVDVEVSLKHDEWHLRHPEVAQDPEVGETGYEEHLRAHAVLDELSARAHSVVDENSGN